mgnify:CR=1 FL=1
MVIAYTGSKNKLSPTELKRPPASRSILAADYTLTLLTPRNAGDLLVGVIRRPLANDPVTTKLARVIRRRRMVRFSITYQFFNRDKSDHQPV